ncbi:MAG: peptidoglycan DD-metalloendopeptidase family protein, partial [Ornithinimicrobium sp.]
MKGIIVGLLAVGLLLGFPLSTAVLVASVATPAIAQEHQTLSCEGVQPATGQWRPPYENAYTQTSQFGHRFHPTHKKWRLHAGVDLVSQPPGGTVVAASGGRVTAAGWSTGGGNTVTIDHGGDILTRYLHLAAPSPLSPGQLVHAGQQVGVEGATGESTGSHLHFEVHTGGQPVDPVPFMAERGAALSGVPVAPSPAPGLVPELPEDGEGGIGFELPAHGEPRQDSLHNPPLPIPPGVQALYEEAGAEYAIPWALLAGIGMVETAHGANTATSSAGARGLMQFMPATFAAHGIDGDGDGLADINNTADSVHSAANYLTASGVTRGEQGVREALFAYNHADWYVNDVLFYAHTYGGGLVLGDPLHCDAQGG